MPSAAGFTLCLPVLDSATTESRLAELVYELLDAHGDTMRLADEFAETSGWSAHLDYLRDLQRVGRELLARLDAHVP
jgi:hypothetical protein